MSFYFKCSLTEKLQAFGLHLQKLEDILRKFEHFSIGESHWNTRIQLTTLQWSLLKLLTTLLFFTALLILYSWKLYGRVITEKFVRQSTLKEIEELKLSVAKLKLPKEHSPRI